MSEGYIDGALRPVAETVAEALSIEVTDLHAGPPGGTVRVARAVMIDERGNQVVGFGAASNRSDARAMSVMECAERLALAQLELDAETRAWRDFGSEAIDPRKIGLYRPTQYPGCGLAPFEESAPLTWVAMQEVRTGVTRLVPLEFVYPREPLQRVPIVAETSSGTAAGTTVESALERALRELIERDALMLAWHRRGRTRIAGQLPDDVMAGIAVLNDDGWITAALRIEQDIALPCILIVAMQGTRMSHGLGCSPDADQAARRALLEVTAGLGQATDAPEFLHLPLTQVLTPRDHSALYNKGPLHSELRAFLARGEPLAETRAEVPARSANDTLGDAGFEPLYRDIASRELRDIGLHIVRAIVPGLVPLSFGYHRLRLGVSRLYSENGPPVDLPHFLN